MHWLLEELPALVVQQGLAVRVFTAAMHLDLLAACWGCWQLHFLPESPSDFEGEDGGEGAARGPSARSACAARTPVPHEACALAQERARADCSAAAWMRASLRPEEALEGPANEGKRPFRILPRFWRPFLVGASQAPTN